MRSVVAAAAAVLFVSAAAPPWAPPAIAGSVDPAAQRQFENGIRQNLRAYFRMNPDIDQKAIRIEVDGNKVILRGEVPDRRTHDRVVQAAWTTSGVQKVIDELAVTGSGDTVGAAFIPPPPDNALQGTTFGDRR